MYLHVTNITDQQLPHGRAISVLSLAVLMAKTREKRQGKLRYDTNTWSTDYS